MNHSRTTFSTLIIAGLLYWLTACAPIPPAAVRPFSDHHDWMLLEPLRYQVGNSTTLILVPKGFVTDYASIPQIFWWYLSPHGNYSEAATVHDFLYWSQKCTKQQADNILMIAMKESRVSWADRKAIYEAVHLLGQKAWESNADEKSKGLLRIVPADFFEIPAGVTWAEYRQQLFDRGVRPDDQVENLSYCSTGDSDQVPTK